ncbi:hypothetical protein ABMA10_04325 [Plantibacter sp. RU18]
MFVLQLQTFDSSHGAGSRGPSTWSWAFCWSTTSSVVC